VKATIGCFSKSGNTRVVVEAVAEEIGPDNKRAFAPYQVVRAAQDILVSLGVLSEQDARR
jgi:flavodoxin